MNKLSYRMITSIVTFGLLFSCQAQPDLPQVDTSLEKSRSSTPTLFTSRVMAIDVKGDLIALGHENGGISMWSLPLKINARPLISWFAHESTVRHIKLSSNELHSLGADGSFARWTKRAKLIERTRLKEGHPNRSLRLHEELLVFGGDRGVLTAMTKGERSWRTAGEHGRAVFSLQGLDDKRLLSVGSDGWARCWLVANGERCGALPIHEGWSTALEEMEGGWVSAGSDGLIKWWPPRFRDDLLKATQRGSRDHLSVPASSHRAHARDITTIDVSGSYVVSGSEEGRVTLLQLSSEDQQKRRFVRHWSYQSESLKPVMSLAIDQARGVVLVGGGSKPQLSLISLEHGALVRTEDLTDERE